jgi:hypothetical protein
MDDLSYDSCHVKFATRMEIPEGGNDGAIVGGGADALYSIRVMFIVILLPPAEGS